MEATSRLALLTASRHVRMAVRRDPVLVAVRSNMADETWTLAELHEELERWRRELVAAGKSDQTVATYVGRSEMFLRWLAGDYKSR